MRSITYYIEKFEKLRRDQKNGGAPHKPILLLSVINLFERGFLDSSKIYFTPELVSTFKSLWTALVDTNHSANIALPFSHMRSEPFWRLIPNEGCEIWIESTSSMRSFNNLKMAVDYALIDKDLSSLLKNKATRDVLTITLLEKYFPRTKSRFFGNDYDPDKNLSLELFKEDSENYRKKILQLKTTLSEEDYEEEIFVRGGIFKREIIKLYNNSCAISGMRINATINVTMVDACHIIPFSESYNDTLTNGIALCPNLHRAFDRGLISVDNEFKVLVSTTFSEKNSDYGIKKFQGKMISLPNNQNYIPLKNNFQWHREHKFVL